MAVFARMALPGNHLIFERAVFRRSVEKQIGPGDSARLSIIFRLGGADSHLKIRADHAGRQLHAVPQKRLKRCAHPAYGQKICSFLSSGNFAPDDTLRIPA